MIFTINGELPTSRISDDFAEAMKPLAAQDRFGLVTTLINAKRDRILTGDYQEVCLGLDIFSKRDDYYPDRGRVFYSERAGTVFLAVALQQFHIATYLKQGNIADLQTYTASDWQALNLMIASIVQATHDYDFDRRNYKGTDGQWHRYRTPKPYIVPYEAKAG